MNDGRQQAPAGWYDDPHAPGRMRYFDGEMWTNHFHEPGRLPDIGSWLGTTFSAISHCWREAVVLVLVTTVIGNVLIWVGLIAVLGDAGIFDEELVGFGTSTVIGFVAVVVVSVLWQGIGWVAASRFMHRAHFQAAPTALDAIGHALRRLPRYLGVMVLLIAAMLVVVFVVSLVSLAAPILGLLAVLGLIVAAVWALVKLAFVVVGVAAAPTSHSVIRASASVSEGRFWPVLGRVLLILGGVWITSALITASLGPLGELVDAERLNEVVQTRGNEVIVQDFRFRDLLPSSSRLLAVIALNSVVQAAGSLVLASGLTRLYLDSGAPAEI